MRTVTLSPLIWASRGRDSSSRTPTIRPRDRDAAPASRQCPRPPQAGAEQRYPWCSPRRLRPDGRAVRCPAAGVIGRSARHLSRWDRSRRPDARAPAADAGEGTLPAGPARRPPSPTGERGCPDNTDRSLLLRWCAVGHGGCGVRWVRRTSGLRQRRPCPFMEADPPQPEDREDVDDLLLLKDQVHQLPRPSPKLTKRTAPLGLRPATAGPPTATARGTPRSPGAERGASGPATSLRPTGPRSRSTW